VKAIAPMVFDTLNMQAQLPHQVKSFGKPSEMISDYVKRGLVPMPKTERAMKLWSMVDPWVYREKVKVPTLILNGANDPYWSTDALNLYWNDLKQPRWICYVPNAGHDLRQDKTDITRVGNSLGAFARCQIHDIKMPTLTWKHDDADGKARLSVTSDIAPKAARLWVADGETRDFRKSTWKEQAVTLKDKSATGVVDLPQAGNRVFFGELEFSADGLTYYLSTQMRVLEKK
jgi:PhoPQ-activated pathogenicity-related protein